MGDGSLPSPMYYVLYKVNRSVDIYYYHEVKKIDYIKNWYPHPIYVSHVNTLKKETRYMPYVAPLLEIAVQPVFSQLLSSAGQSDIVDKFNSMWAGSGGVMFGHGSDPYADRFLRFQQTVLQPQMEAIELIKNTAAYVQNNGIVFAVACEDDLLCIPPVMHVPILTYAPIREYFVNNRIEGWGVQDLPNEDSFGRLYENGTVEQHIDEQDQLVTPEYMQWEWEDGDPDFDYDEINMINDSRLFIDDFIKQQLGPDGELKDPTGMLFGSLIKSKKK